MSEGWQASTRRSTRFRWVGDTLPGLWPAVLLVDVLGRYSRQPHLARVARRLLELRGAGPGRVESVARRERRVDRRVDAETLAALTADYEGGCSTEELAAKYQLNKASVRRLAHEAGVQMRRVQLTDGQRAECARLYGEGLNIREVAARLGVPKITVQNALRTSAVVMRASGRGGG